MTKKGEFLMKSEELCIFIERLRSARNISQETFTEGVVSLRQYRRYLNGESDIPFQIIHRLTSKIGVKTDNLLREFEKAKIEETNLINRMYNLVANLALEEFLTLQQQIPLDHIIEYTNRIVYQHSLILYKYYTKQFTKAETAEENALLIGYPKILETKIITSVEMLILSSFLDYLDQSHHEKILIKIKEYINDQTLVITGGNERMYTLVLARYAKYMGVLEDYDNVIKYCNLGIERSLSSKSYYLLDYFYYYNSLAYYRKGDFDQYERMIVNCYHVLHIDSIQSKIDKFTNLINEDFDIDFETFVIEYYNKKQSKN